MKHRGGKLWELELRSIEEPELDFIHKMQNECAADLAWLFDTDDLWLPMSRAQVAEKVAEIRKGDHHNILAVWSEDDFVGVLTIFAEWDTWCPGASFIIWPEFRRMGIGTCVAELMLDKVFNQYHGHMINDCVSELNEAGQRFMESLGMKPCGRIRRVAVRDGKYIDAVCYDLLKSEYLTARKTKGVRRRRH